MRLFLDIFLNLDMYKGAQRGRTRGISVWEDRRRPKNFRPATQVIMMCADIFDAAPQQEAKRQTWAMKSNLSLSLFIHCAGENWIDVSLDDFADCESNLAANRQTRMLADLALVNCYNKTSMPLEERNRLLLASAKRNLAGELFILQQQNTQE